MLQWRSRFSAPIKALVRPDTMPSLGQGAWPHQSAHASRPRRGGNRMKRRDFLALLGGAAAVYPLTVHAQQPARMSRIGWIAIGTPQGSEFFEAVKQGLRELGYVEG